MVAVVRVQFNAQEATRALAQLGAKAARVIPRALNRAGTSARAAMVTVIAKDMGLKAGAVRERITIVEATRARQVVTLHASAKRIPLMEFGASTSSRGVSARAQGGRKKYPQAFIATMGSQHEGVFQRVGRPRLPIRELFGASIAHVFDKHVAVGQARGHEALLKNLQSEIKFALSQP